MNNGYEKIKIKLNGVERSLEVEAEETLADVLRDKLQLTGTKINCRQGECGACTVIMDGKAVASCLLLAVRANGSEVTTIEGLSREGEMDEVQEAFIEKDGAQCGFCTPGMIMSAKALLLKKPNPSTEEIKTALAGNLCRCTGYAHIIDSVQRAVDKISREKTIE